MPAPVSCTEYPVLIKSSLVRGLQLSSSGEIIFSARTYVVRILIGLWFNPSQEPVPRPFVYKCDHVAGPRVQSPGADACTNRNWLSRASAGEEAEEDEDVVPVNGLGCLHGSKLEVDEDDTEDDEDSAADVEEERRMHSADFVIHSPLADEEHGVEGHTTRTPISALDPRDESSLLAIFPEILDAESAGRAAVTMTDPGLIAICKSCRSRSPAAVAICALICAVFFASKSAISPAIAMSIVASPGLGCTSFDGSLSLCIRFAQRSSSSEVNPAVSRLLLLLLLSELLSPS
jgi:hypothetical protein